MYLRFVVAKTDQKSARELGIFHALRDLRYSGELYPYEDEQCDSIIQWFNEHLTRPTRFTASKPPFYRKSHRAICWFKDTAREHLGWAWSMAAMVQYHQVPARLLKAQRVGYAVYEDEYQIAAEPFADA